MTGMQNVSDEERLKAQIAHTRQELGETVEALAAKADVPARVKRRGAELGHEAHAKVAQTPTSWWLAAGGALAALLALVVFLRRRS